MRIVKEIVHTDSVNITPGSTPFSESKPTWLYWDPYDNKWTWAHQNFPHVHVRDYELRRNIVYYFAYCEFIKCLYFMYGYDIQKNKWYRSYELESFRYMTISESLRNTYIVREGERCDIYVYDKNGPYIRRIIHPQSESFSEKSWKWLSWINPFRK